MVVDKSIDRLPQAADQGGWLVTDQEAIAAQRGVVWELVKKVGQSLTQGASLTSVTLPITISEPRSYLEMVTDGWCHAPLFLKQAAGESDPVERMKLVMTFAVSGLSNTCVVKKPFNPIVGETLEGSFADGTQIFCEQVSHHPPITNWEVIGPGSMYTFFGSGELTASFRANSVKGHQQGKHHIDFELDGGRVSYELPEVWVRGVMLGERIIEYDGVMKFWDLKNKLYGEVKINEAGASSGWFSFKKKPPTDLLTGNIFKYKGDDCMAKDREALTKITGSWMGCILFDGKKYWSFKDNLPKFELLRNDNPLPSDSRYRNDIVFLLSKDLEAAGELKAELENKQRAEGKLRKAYCDKNGITYVPV